jgi:hypothetical protein
MNKFEQLIEYVINDEEAKARELFHEIVVEKSRAIYEEIMSEEDLEEVKDEDEDDKEKVDEAEDEDIDEAMGGDAAKDLIDDVEMEEESDMNMEAEDEEEVDVDVDAEMDDEEGDHHSDVGGEEELEDRVMDLEDKLDELMAEFEELMNDDAGDGDDFEADAAGDAIEMDDTEEMMPEMGMTPPMPMEEAVSLKAAPKPVTSEEGGINKKSTVAANSGARGAMADPVKMTGDTAQGRPAPTTKDLITDFQNKAGAGMKDQKPATKPHLAQATGVNTKSPLPQGGKG